jgi:putative DNA methylase
MSQPPRLLIEDWLPAAAIGVECMRERGSSSALAPHTYLHVWWARRPLTASRAAVLASLLPCDFPRQTFERLLGLGRPSSELVSLRQLMDTGIRVGGYGCKRAFTASLQTQDLETMWREVEDLWGSDISVIDPMAGGGSIPLESARLGFTTLANEYNPVACSILEATVDYPLRYGVELTIKARKWSVLLKNRFNKALEVFYPHAPLKRRDGYLFARTVPCPDTQHPTPLVSDWYLLHPKSGRQVVAEPALDKKNGTWTVRVREIGPKSGQLKEPPRPTYSDGKGVSLFTNHVIPADYIKAKAQAGEMGSALYAIVLKTNKGFEFQPPEPLDLEALRAAERELKRRRPCWEKTNIIPTELYPKVSSDERPRLYGMTRWADMFSSRQLLCFGVLVEEMGKLRKEIEAEESPSVALAIDHLFALAVSKFANYNSLLASWHAPRAVIRSVFDRHDYAFKTTFAELAACNKGMGLDWSIENVLDAFNKLCLLPRSEKAKPVEISLGSATNLPQIAGGSITAVVVDPPYADNVQYSELADFFYVWLKRTQGHRCPEWFSTYLSENDQEAVVNVSRHRENDIPVKEARRRAHEFYQGLMRDTFKECKRMLRDDGVLTVMFTHKKQEAWVALFTSLIQGGFTVTATWPVKTESEHSLHQAKKNAAQSTVILVARKRPMGAGVGYFDEAMKREIRDKARSTAERLQREGLNPVDQLVGSFGPAMEVYSRHDEVRTDTGLPVVVDKAIDEAADAVSAWRIEQLAARGLDGVEPEGQFALLCWDVLAAAEFRFNEAKLLGHAVGMDVDQLVVAGLVTKSGDKIQMVPAKERRRHRALDPDEVEETLFGKVTVSKKRTKKDVLKVHPNDPRFRTALDACHALALRYIEGGRGSAGTGSAKALTRQQRWTPDSPVARLMEALVHAAPPALRHEKGKQSAAAKFPEFKAWHELLEPLFDITPPDWTEQAPPQSALFNALVEEDEESVEEDEGAEG